MAQQKSVLSWPGSRRLPTGGRCVEEDIPWVSMSLSRRSGFYHKGLRLALEKVREGHWAGKKRQLYAIGKRIVFPNASVSQTSGVLVLLS